MTSLPYRQQRVIDQLQRDLDNIEKTWPMTANYARHDPYIIDFMQAGQHFELIIYHFESKTWYGDHKDDYILSTIAKHSLIKPNDVVFDLGCNAGAICVVMASICQHGGMVHAFDPYPWNAVATRCNAALNGLDNVRSYPVGISNRSFKIEVSPNDSRIYEKSEASNAHVIAIEDYRNFRHLKPTFLKIDIEGSEHDLFEDRDPQMFASVRGFALEFHPFWIRPRGIEPVDSLRSIMASGFSLHPHTVDSEAFDPAHYNEDNHMFWGDRQNQAALASP